MGKIVGFDFGGDNLCLLTAAQGRSRYLFDFPKAEFAKLISEGSPLPVVQFAEPVRRDYPNVSFGPPSTLGLVERSDQMLQSHRSQLRADSVEKQRVAGAESGTLNEVRAPFWSGFSRLLRCRKGLCQFAEVLSGSGEEEFVVCAAWAA